MLKGFTDSLKGQATGKGYIELAMAEVSSRRSSVQPDNEADEDWQAPARRKRDYVGPTVMSLGALVCLVVGWTAGKGSQGSRVVERVRVLASTSSPLSFGTAPRASGLPCDPYLEHGMLNISLENPSENRWIPIDSPCQAVDYTSLIRQAQDGGAIAEELSFARDKTIVILGDSVDRDHNEHFCGFVNGWHEMIPDHHELSPPYPEGEEHAPEDYKNPFDGSRNWPNWDQSRPFICHVGKLNLRILNVFHYGYRNKTDWIRHHPHFYPPARVEDRIDQIVVPLVANMARKFGTSPVPDLFTMTPGFWGLLRQAQEDDRNRQALLDSGVSEEEANRRYDVWRSMTKEQREWNQERTLAIIRHMAKKWPLEDGSHEVYRRPKLIWRALHQIKAHRDIPFDRLQSLDQIGRAVVDKLIAEGRAAEGGSSTWEAWTSRLRSHLGLQLPDPTLAEAYSQGLGYRLKVDEWGARILGTSVWFRDDMHPQPLPGNYLWSNMIMHHLREAVAERELS